ncbi:MAG TPA: TIM barrel protein [Fimbriimonas sp.]|nr:TIM barrel protein [Fimbriimonas sp.]
MRFGICCSLDEAPAMVDAGFDYVELAASAFADNPDVYKGLPVEATNIFFASSIHLFGPNATPWRPYVAKLLAAASDQGVKVMVIGSGNARKAPDAASAADCDEQFMDICAEIDSMASEHGMAIAPESLNREETNVGNDLGRLALGMQARGSGYTADGYHVLREWRANLPHEPLPDVSLWREQVPYEPTHVHFADYPRDVPAEDDEMVLTFFRRLRETGYDDRISFEGSRSGLNPKQILERTRKMWERSC